jgi:hypothetical protein
MNVSRTAANAVRTFAALAVLTGAVTILGWLGGWPALTDWFGTTIGMQFNTALASVLAGTALLLCSRASMWARTTRVIGGAVFVFCLATLSQHVHGVDLGIDTLFHTPTFKQNATAAPGRMGPPASLSFALCGLAVIFLTLRVGVLRHAAGWIGLFVMMVALLSLVGYIYGAGAMYSSPRLTGIAAQTAISITGLGAALAISAGVQGPGRLWNHQGAAGLLVRRVLPAAVLVPVIIGWLRIQGERAGWYDGTFGAALRTIVEVVLFGTLLWIAARAVAAREAAAKAAERELEAYRESL